MKQLLFLLLTALISSSAIAQQLIWSEDFEGTISPTWSLNTTDSNSTNAGENEWVINNEYNGPTIPIIVPNTPTQPASFNGGPTSTYMHISSAAARGGGQPQNAHYSFLFDSHIKRKVLYQDGFGHQYGQLHFCLL